LTRPRPDPHPALFSDVTDLLRFVNRAQGEAPWERRLRLALKYGTANIQTGQCFADHSHLALDYPLSNTQGGRKRRHKQEPKLVPWYQRF